MNPFNSPELREKNAKDKGSHNCQLDIGNYKPNSLLSHIAIGDYSTFFEDVIDIILLEDKTLNTFEVPESGTLHLSASRSLLKELWLTFKIKNHELLDVLQHDNHNNETSFTNPSACFMAGNMPIGPVSPFTPGMREKIGYHPNPGPEIPNPVSNEMTEPQNTKLWVQCLDDNTLSGNQHLLPRGTDTSNTVKHNEPT